MKRVLVFSILAGLFLFACSKQKSEVKLQAGTPAYDLAKSLSEKVPYLDPDKNNVMVKTNDANITSGEVIQALEDNFGKRTESLKNMPADQINQVVEKNAKDLAEKKLLLKAAAEANVTIPDSEIDSTLQQQYKSAGGQDKFMQFLQNTGIQLDHVKASMRDGLTIQKFLDQKLAGQDTVTERELQDAYKQDKYATVRHILLMTKGLSDSAKQAVHAKMEKILAEARSGKDFAELAKEYSEDPGSKKNGGLYTNFTRGQMVKPFEDAAFSVPVGQISDIVETQYGYHIIKVIERKKEDKPFNEIKDQLKAQLLQRKKNDAYSGLLEQLRTDANMEVVPYN